MRRMKVLFSSSLLAGTLLAQASPVYAAPALEKRPTVVVNYGGSDYVITSKYTNYTTDFAFLQSQPWWGNLELAYALSALVEERAGYFIPEGSVFGVAFAYSTSIWGRRYTSAAIYPLSLFPPLVGLELPIIPSDIDLYYAVIGQLVTLESLAGSLQSTSAGVTSINNSLNMMINGAHSRPLARLVAPGQKTFWLAGDWGRDDHGNRSGSTGMAELGVGYRFDFAQFNLSIGQTWARQDLMNDGEVKADGQYLMLESIIPLTQVEGLYATLGAYGHWGEADMRRGYINMSVPDSSKSSPDTQTWGVRARLDWQNALSFANTGISPYIDLSYTNSHMDSYSEKGGGIPARFEGRTDDYTEARLGFNTQTPLPFASGYDFVTNLEVAHRFERNAAGINGEVEGFFTFNLPGEDITNDWIKAGVGVEGEAGPGKLSFMLNGTTKSEMPNFWVATSYQLAF